MAFIVHSDWLERQFNGTEALDLDGAGSVINMGIVTESTIDADTNALYSGLTAVATGTAWTGPVALANKTCGQNASNDLVFDADDPAQIAQDAGTGFANARSIVIFGSVNSFILAHHIETTAFGNTLGPITVSFDATNGIWKATI